MYRALVGGEARSLNQLESAEPGQPNGEWMHSAIRAAIVCSQSNLRRFAALLQKRSHEASVFFQIAITRVKNSNAPSAAARLRR